MLIAGVFILSESICRRRYEQEEESSETEKSVAYTESKLLDAVVAVKGETSAAKVKVKLIYGTHHLGCMPRQREKAKNTGVWQGMARKL